MRFEEQWRFETARFAVCFEIAPEDMDPADSFQFPEDIEAVRNGDVDWFQARVAVYDRESGAELGADYLGGCAYKNAREFYTSHRDKDPSNRNTLALKAQKRAICHYFPSMVSQAIDEARRCINKYQDSGIHMPKQDIATWEATRH